VALNNTLVSYRNVTKPFPDVQTLLGKTREAAGKVIPNASQADARVSQVAVGLAAMQREQGKFPRVMHTPRDPTASLLQSHIAANAVRENKVESFVMKGIAHVLEAFDVKFSSSDWLGWMLSFFTWIEDIDPAVFLTAPEEPAAIPNNFNMAVIGDWGTGLYGAPFCSQSIQNDPDGYDLLLHLGDIYYSGLPDEVTDRFLDLWPKVPKAINRSLNGNHEMYTGGHAYFEELLPKFGQTSSYFAFQNDFWILAALDSAYSQPFGGQEGNLNQQQVDWLNRIVANSGDRKLVLFSHHQPFSLLDSSQGPLLVQWLQPLLAAGKIFAWYWGHEHRCVLYDPHPAFRLRGRCVGHGGFPQERIDLSNATTSPDLGSQWKILPGTQDHKVPGGKVLDTANLYIPGFEEQFSPHGFMRLEFRGARLNELVRAPGNDNIYSRDLT